MDEFEKMNDCHDAFGAAEMRTPNDANCRRKDHRSVNSEVLKTSEFFQRESFKAIRVIDMA